MTAVLPRRVLVAGSRDWDDRATVRRELTDLAYDIDPEGLTVVHGACPEGADLWANEWAIDNRQFAVNEPHPADWDTYGMSAGFRRNAEMVATRPDLVLIFLRPCRKPHCKRHQSIHFSHGAADTANQAVKAGLPVREWFQP